MSGTTALVTGATGFTGSHLVSELLARGCAVRVLARSAVRARTLFGTTVDIVEGDVVDATAVDAAVRDRRLVFHLATSYREPGLPDRRYREVHVDATRSLIEAAARHGVQRFVHCSTVGVLGHVEHPPADETTPPNPGDIYQETKWEGEQLALALGRERGVPVAVARPTAIYGPGDLRLLKMFRAIARRRFVILGDGRIFYHMVYVTDLIEGFWRLATSSRAVGEVFILGGARYVSLNELAAAIAAACGVGPPRLHLPLWPVQAAGSACEWICKPFGIAPPIYRRRVDFYAKSRAFSIEKARRLIGYAPAVDLEEGLARTIAWYRNEGYLPAASGVAP